MSNTEPLYDLSMFKQLDEDDPGALVTLVSVFIATTPDILAELNKAYQAKDMMALAHHSHKIKSTIDTLRINSLVSVIRQIEQLAKTGNTPELLPDLIDKLNTDLNEVFIRIRKEIS